ncbi:MAG: type 4a pilus biogenesis protein PilO [Candidatus Margulisbacteria bacterium]|nr:type 4a pilus biogenesis protein PilO [Candidatus Margulisiibacteriota bacterium]
MAPVKLSEREKRLVIITGALLVFYVFYQFLLVPKWGEVGRLKDQARKVRLELRIAEGKMKILEAMEKSLGAMPEMNVSSASNEQKALEVFKAISQAASNSKLNLSSIRPIVDNDQEKGLRFEISCTGKYKNLYTFLEMMHGLNLPIMIDSLEVNGGGETSPTLSIKMQLSAHY